MFKFTNYVMLFAPIGRSARDGAFTIGTQDRGVLVNLGKLSSHFTFATEFIFVVLVFGHRCVHSVRLPIRAILPRRARARVTGVRKHKQRIGVNESDA